MKVGRPTHRSTARRAAFLLLALVIVAGPQLAALGAIGRFGSRALPGVSAGAFTLFTCVVVALNLALALEFGRAFRIREVPRWMRLALFYPYYIWWFGSMLFAFIAGWTELVTLPLVLAGMIEPLHGPVLALLVATAYLLGAYGVFSGAVGLRPEEIDVPIANLPPGWEGARIVQISDIHAGRHVGEARVRAVAATAAEAKPDLVVLTGDLVDASAVFALEAARAIASIPSRLGIFAVLGNHDYYGGAEEVVAALRGEGIHVLRNEGVVLHRDGGRLFLAGVDEAWFRRTDLPKALADRPERLSTILLSHHPELFPDAAGRGVDLQLSGHTHGGQIGLVRLHPSLSLYRLISPFVAGLYRQNKSLLYVNRGVGTVQPLIRIGAPPEVTVLTLRAGDPGEAEALCYEPDPEPEPSPALPEPA